MLVLLVLRNFLTSGTRVLCEKLIVIQLVTRISPNPKKKSLPLFPTVSQMNQTHLNPPYF